MKYLRFFLIYLLLLPGAGMANAEDSFIKGIAPHTSAHVILEMYQPLRIYMEKALGRLVAIATTAAMATG